MAEYSTNYTQNTTDITVGTEIYKCSRVVSTVNPSTMDNSCIYCGSDTPIKTDYFPCNSVNAAEKSELDSKWNIASNEFKFTNSVTEKPFNICFVRCNYSGTSSLAGLNSVYQIGKSIYNEGQSNVSSNMSVLNPFDIRKIIFFPQFDGYLGTSYSAVNNKDLKYVMDNKDNFFINQMTMTCFVWNGTSYTSVSSFQVRPCIVGDDYFIPINARENIHNFSTSNYNTSKTYNQAFYGARDESNMPISHIAIPTDKNFPFTTEPTETNSVADGLKFHASYNWYTSDFFIFSNADQILKMLAYCGCYFVDSSYNTSGKTLNTFWNDEHIYLGEMKEGAKTTGVFIKGTDLLTSDTINKGEFSSQTEFNPVPPPSGTDEDEDTAITTNGAPFGTGLAHYYVTTVDSVTLQHISEAMSTWDIDTTKKDLYKNLISCKIIKPPAGIPSTSGVFTIYGEKPQYNGADITIPEVTGNPSITLGPYSISRKFNDFRDYAPYSKAEIFIPYCGWTALPSHVIGRSVYVDYFTDVIAGTVKGVIRCGNNAVAEAAGVMAVDIPFAAQNVGAKVAAATTGMLSYGQGALQASVGIGQAVATKGKSGIKNITSGLASVIGAYNQMAMVNNENWTEINGKSGDGCALAGIDTIIIKITRPKYGSYTEPYYVPADYGHTVGFVSMKKATVGSCTGLIICDNADTSGISGATDRERQLIKEYLESGVIVRHPE